MAALDHCWVQLEPLVIYKIPAKRKYIVTCRWFTISLEVASMVVRLVPRLFRGLSYLEVHRWLYFGLYIGCPCSRLVRTYVRVLNELINIHGPPGRGCAPLATRGRTWKTCWNNSISATCCWGHKWSIDFVAEDVGHLGVPNP